MSLPTKEPEADVIAQLTAEESLMRRFTMEGPGVFLQEIRRLWDVFAKARSEQREAERDRDHAYRLCLKAQDRCRFYMAKFDAAKREGECAGRLREGLEVVCHLIPNFATLRNAQNIARATLAKNPAPVSDRSAAKSDDGLSPAVAPTPPASGAGPHEVLTERDPWEELRVIEEEMKARGIVDVKFAWSPEARNKGSDELARDVVKFLRACLDGRTQPAPPVGDSHRAEPFEKTRGELAGWLYWEAESRSKDNHIRYRMLRRWEQWVKALAQVAPRVEAR